MDIIMNLYYLLTGEKRTEPNTHSALADHVYYSLFSGACSVSSVQSY